MTIKRVVRVALSVWLTGTFSAWAGVDDVIVEPPAVRATYAAAGDPGAQYNLAVAYLKGDGMLKDPVKAAQWFRKAAEQGLPDAQYNIGLCCATGTGVTKNPSEAVRWFIAASYQGVFAAQKMLIRCYAEGWGVEKSPGKALLWDFLARRTLELREGQPAGEPERPPRFHADTFSRQVSGGLQGTSTETKAEQQGAVDGRKVTQGNRGTIETVWPDGRRWIEGDALTPDGRIIRAWQKFDPRGRLSAQRFLDGSRVIERAVDGSFAMEFLAEDQSGEKVTLIERFDTHGKLAARDLVRADGRQRAGEEKWTITRWLEIRPGTEVQVIERYGQGGSVLSHEVLTGTERAMLLRTVNTEPAAQRGTSPSPSPVAQVRPVMRIKGDIEKKLEELKAIAHTYGFYAGATNADYEYARAAAGKFMIALHGAPQKPLPLVSSRDRPRSSSLKGGRHSRLVESPTDLSEKYPLGLNGRVTISRRPWKHAETEHFVVHYAEAADAYPVVRFVESAYSVVTQALAVEGPESQQKSHVFIFPNNEEWEAFLIENGMHTGISGFAYKDELFLGARGGKDEYLKTFCHEAAHAIVARFYRARQWPLWLSEGFAEYMGAKSLAVRRNHPVQRYLGAGADRSMDLDRVFSRLRYGVSSGEHLEELRTFYANSEKCVRVLNERLPTAAFPRFVNLIVAGNSVEASLREAYGSTCSSIPALKRLIDQTTD